MKKMYVVSVAVVFLLSSFTSNSYAFWKKKKTLIPRDGFIEIPVSDVNDGVARFYRVEADDGTTVTFFLVKSSDNVIRVAINACDVCYREGKGYEQGGNYMICINCDQRFAADKINNISGGCNPVPLPRQINGNTVVLSMEDINKNRWYFQNVQR